MADKDITIPLAAVAFGSMQPSPQPKRVGTTSAPNSGSAPTPAQNDGPSPAQGVSDETPENLSIEAAV